MATQDLFYEYASGLIASSSALSHRWSEDRLNVIFPKKNEGGFDVEVVYDPDSNTLEIHTDRGYHDHFHAEQFESFPDALACVFSLVRDLLSRNMRIEETLANGRARKWQLQAHINGEWVTESTTGLLIWSIFGSKSTVEYSNDVLPPRELSRDA